MSSSSASSFAVTSRHPEDISRRAYEIWEREGRPDGCDLRHWLQAEQELSAEASTGQSARAASESSAGSNGQPAPSRDSDVTPLQGTRAASAAAREPKRGSASPFEREKSKRRGSGATM